MATITININGIADTLSALNGFNKDLEDMSMPLDTSSKQYLNVISMNFIDNGKTFGKEWKPLSKRTIKEKRYLKKQGKSIGVEKPLYRTGAMKKGFSYNLNGKNKSNIFNVMNYSIIHQEGRGNIPQRILADIDEKRIIMVSDVFTTWINGLLKKYKLS